LLERSFIHVQGIGYQTERRLWDQGADCWQTFLADPTSFRVPKTRFPLLLDTVGRSAHALERGDHRFFRERLPTRDHWRALKAFPERVAYLDIETDGGTNFDSVTVIGLYDRNGLRQFVRGENLLDFEEALGDTAVLVTFYGGGFDIPVLRTAFPRVRFDQLHVDLCPTLRRLGLRGGLKSIEQQLGIRRSAGTAGLTGWDAVRLWREWRWGKRPSLETLLAYNAEDVVNMVPLAELAWQTLSERLLKGETSPVAEAAEPSGE
jgi:uncharacterized protein YprB with RNaseH-like and TPR domain